VIYHIADRSRWEASLATGEYTASSLGAELADEGFIHLSTEAQWPGTLARFYDGVDDLVLLHVDEARLASPLVFERLGAATEDFPHLYGPLNCDAVVEVAVLRP
jgi:glutathione S-transferase